MIRKIRSLLQSTLLLNILLCIVYVVAAKLSLRLAFVNASATAVWPPTGIAIASLLLLGRRVWPAIYIGAFLSNVTTAGTIITSLCIAFGNTAEGLVGAYLIEKFTKSIHAFERPRTVGMLALAIFDAAVVSATIGVTTLAIAGLAPWNMYANVWLTWWLGDITGGLIVVPALILWFTPIKTMAPAKPAEIVLFTFVFLGLCYWIFFGNMPQPYLLMPLLLWSVFRFEPRETATAVLALSAIGIWATLHNTGPFIKVADSPNQALLFLQLFVATVSITKMTVAALVNEWRSTKQALTQREQL